MCLSNVTGTENRHAARGEGQTGSECREGSLDLEPNSGCRNWGTGKDGKGARRKPLLPVRHVEPEARGHIQVDMSGWMQEL